MGWIAAGPGERLLASSSWTIDSEGMAWNGTSQDKTLEEASPKVEAGRGPRRHAEERAESAQGKRLCMAPREVLKAKDPPASKELSPRVGDE
jgi:hypothetical protein